MDTRITANSDTLMRQAPMTATLYLDAAIQEVEGRFGEGSAKDHPEIVGAFMTASALDFGASVIARALETIADRPSGLRPL